MTSATHPATAPVARTGAAPAGVLVLAADPDPGRAAAWRRLLGAEHGVTVQSGKPVPDVRGFCAVVLDGPQPALGPDAVAALAGRVRAGGSLLALAGAARGDGPLADLLGGRGTGALPETELAVRVADRSHPLTRRLDGEFMVRDRLDPLEEGARGRALLRASVSFRDRLAAVERAEGAGRVVLLGFAGGPGALDHPVLGALIRRALRDGAASDRSSGVGIVGYGPPGGTGFGHALAVGAVEGLHLAAVCDTVPDRLAGAARDFPKCRQHRSLSALAADDDVDIAIVATPPVLHAAMCRALLEAGKHVVCEKPLSLGVADADELAATAAAAGLVLTVNQNRRWDADFVALRRAVESGLLGDVFNIETFVGGFEHPCREWHSEDSISGGAVYDWGAHHVDWMLQLIDTEPASVSSVGHKRVWHDVSNLDQVRVRLRWDDGREAQFLQSDVAAVRPPKFFVQGTGGTLAGWYRPLRFESIEPGRGYRSHTPHHAEAPVELVVARYDTGRGVVEMRLPPVTGQPFPLHRNLADHLQLGDPLAVTPQSARRVVAVLEAAVESERRGTPVALARG